MTFWRKQREHLEEKHLTCLVQTAPSDDTPKCTNKAMSMCCGRSIYFCEVVFFQPFKNLLSEVTFQKWKLVQPYKVLWWSWQKRSAFDAEKLSLWWKSLSNKRTFFYENTNIEQTLKHVRHVCAERLTACMSVYSLGREQWSITGCSKSLSRGKGHCLSEWALHSDKCHL